MSPYTLVCQRAIVYHRRNQPLHWPRRPNTTWTISFLTHLRWKYCLANPDPDVFQLAAELSETIPSVLRSEESRVTDDVSQTLNSQTVPEHTSNIDEQSFHNTADEQLICRNVCECPTVSRDKTHVSDIRASSARQTTHWLRTPGPHYSYYPSSLPENSVEDVIDQVQQHLRDTTGLHYSEVSVNLIVRFGVNLVSEICKRITNKALQDSAQYAHPTETAFINVIDQLLLHTRRGGLGNPPPTTYAHPPQTRPRGWEGLTAHQHKKAI